jgi:hypothetical protein
MDSRLTLAGAVLFAAGALLLAIMLVRIIRSITYRPTDARKAPPKSPHLFYILPALLLIVVGQGFFWLSSQLEYFRPVSPDGSLGQVGVERLSDPIRSLAVIYVPLINNSTSLPNRFYLSGDSWRLNGELVDFKFGRKLFNLPERAYKTVRFESRFSGQLPENVSGVLLNENLLEGGPSQAFRLFRDSRYFKWFASVDSFSTDFITTERADRFTIKLEPNGSAVLERGK